MRENCTSGSGAARLAAILAGVSPANSRSSGPVVVISSGRKGDRPNRKPGSRSPLGLGKPGLIRRRGASNLTGRSVSEPGSLEMRAPRETDCGNVGSAELLRSRRRPCRHRRPEPRRCPNSPGSQRTACQERMDSESPEPLVDRRGAPAQQRHHV